MIAQKLRDSARGQECTLRLPGICLGGTETTVLCHLPSRIGLKGTGMKVPDYWAVFGCHACHDVIDRRTNFYNALQPYVWAALQRTWAIWFELGLLRVAGDSDKPRAKPKSSKIMARPAGFRR